MKVTNLIFIALALFAVLAVAVSAAEAVTEAPEAAERYGDSACTARGGTCMHYLSCSGTTQSGLCAGDYTRKCCIPRSTSSSSSSSSSSGGDTSRCTARGGTCMDYRNCRSTYTSGLCPGSSSNKCCIPSSSSSSGSSSSSSSSSSGGSCSGASDWSAALSNSRITFQNYHQSGVVDNANALAEARDAAAGRRATLSRYQNAPGGTVCLNPVMARVLTEISRQGSVYVNEIAGGSHSVGSAHYRGIAIDIGRFNNVRLTSGYSGSRTVIDACRRLGASKIFHSSLGCGPTCNAHSSWVHCRWN